MVPAPAQGAMVVVAQSAQTALLEELSVLNDPQSALCTQIEREFLNELEDRQRARRAGHHQPGPTALYRRIAQFRWQAAYRNQHLRALGPGARIRQKNGPKIY